jgi:hypothetical protein
MKFSDGASAQARALWDRWAGAPITPASAFCDSLTARLSTEAIAPPRVRRSVAS